MLYYSDCDGKPKNNSQGEEMFIDAIHDYKQGKIQVVERTKAGNRRFVEYPADYTFYYTHPAGTYKTMYGDSCKKYSTNIRIRHKSDF